MASLKNKAISGASWSLTGRFLKQGTQFILGILLARLLSPEEYGLVAMAGVFIFISYVFVDSGFSSALVQKKTCSNADYSTVFYINLTVSLIAVIIFYFTAPLISKFYNEPQLTDIVRVLSLIIILYALTLVQNSIIKREVNFKLQTRIEFIAQILSGAIAIILAYKGFGVWALIWKTLLNQIFINIQLWLKNNWFPSLVFSKNSYKQLFSFSSKLLISGIINKIYLQMYKLVIGKFFPAKELGFYTRAEQFKNLPLQTVSGSLTSFLLPVLAKMQDEPERMKNATLKILKIVMFFNINAMILLAIISEPLINVLLGDKWSGTVTYLQLLVFEGILFPMHLINVQLITALGRTDLLLKIEILKKIVGIPAIMLGIFISIKAMILGMIFTSIIALSINTHYTKKLIDLGLIEQFKSISKSLLIAFIQLIILGPLVYFISSQINQVALLFLVAALGFFIVIFLAKILEMEEYYEIQEIIINRRNRFGRK